MATLHESVLYDVNDAKVTPLLTDTETAPTYDSVLVDVPGIAAVSAEPNINSNELKGDAKVIAVRANVDRFNVSATYGRLSLDVLVVVIGGAVVDTSGSASSAKWSMPGTNSLPYFKAMFQILQGEVADTHITLWKAQVTGGTLIDQSTDNFGQPKIDFQGIPCQSDENKFYDIEYLDTVTPLA